jgi:fatty acid desaturase
MAVAARVNPKDYFTADEWTALSAHSRWKGLAMVAHAWIVMMAAGAMVVLLPGFWFLTVPLAVMIIGARQLGLAILMHDAAHRALSSDPRVNDFVGQWLCGAPVGAGLESYRNYHLGHHKFAQQAEDPDLGLSAPFPITRQSLRRKMARDLTGQTFAKQRTAVLRARLKARKPGQSALSIWWAEAVRLRSFLLWNLGILVVLSAMGLWWAYFVLWLLPMATWYPLVTRLRNIAEHACIAKDEPDPLRHARTTQAGLIERALIAPYYVNYHCEHHMFMHLPCYQLPAAHRILKRTGALEAMRYEPGGYPAVIQLATAA